MGVLFATLGNKGSATRPVQASPSRIDPSARDTARATSTPAPLAGATGLASPDVPVINVDALPVASANVELSRDARDNRDKDPSRLLVVATPGLCNVTVDGVPQGVTPLSPLELAPGAHNVECKPPRGKTRVARVTVQEGATTRYKFTLE
jgi:hypothetical protein